MVRNTVNAIRPRRLFQLPVLELLETRLPPGNMLSGLNSTGVAIVRSNIITEANGTQSISQTVISQSSSIPPSATSLDSLEPNLILQEGLLNDPLANGLQDVDFERSIRRPGASRLTVNTYDAPNDSAQGVAGSSINSLRPASGAQVVRVQDRLPNGLGVGAGRGDPRARLNVMLLADTNRDGVVTDGDTVGKENWTKDLGAIYNVNFDDDNSDGQPDSINFDDDGRPFAENKIIENGGDRADLAPLVIKSLGRCLPPGMQVYLKTASVEDAQSIHVFPSIAAGTRAILGDIGNRAVGGSAAATEVDITSYVNCKPNDVTFGVEGLNFRYGGADVPSYKSFDGYVDLTLELRNGPNVLKSSDARMKVAPWISSTHDEKSMEVWAQDLGSSNAAFLYNEFAEPGYYGLDNTGQLHTVDNNQQAGTRWFQDQAESGWTQRPGGPKQQVIFRLPYTWHNSGNPQPPWPQQELLRRGIGTFQVGILLSTMQDYMGDWGGNVEALPPTSEHPLGRIVHGDLGSSALKAFFDSQEVQATVVPPSRWLIIGHVDEYMMFVGGNRVAVADPQYAYDLMEAISVEDRGKSVFFATGANPISGVVSANSESGTILWTGMDLTGTNWKYVRIYDSSASGSNAAGQVARIAPGGLQDGYVIIDTVWNTGSIVKPFSGSPLGGWVDGRFPRAGDKFVLTEGSKNFSGSTPGFITVHEILADNTFRTVNVTDAQGQINIGKEVLDSAAGGPGSLEFIKVPILYRGTHSQNFATARSAVAYTPNVANMYPLGDHVYTGKQYSPRNNAGEDIFEKAVAAQIPALFVDDWSAYHLGFGGLHCGVLGVRETPDHDWWVKQP